MTRNKNLPDHYTNTDTRRMENIAKKLIDSVVNFDQGEADDI